MAKKSFTLNIVADDAAKSREIQNAIRNAVAAASGVVKVASVKPLAPPAPKKATAKKTPAKKATRRKAA